MSSECGRGSSTPSSTRLRRFEPGGPRQIRLVNAANAFIHPSNSPEAARGFAAFFEALTRALCDNAKAHGALCVDVRQVLNGPDFAQPVNDSSQEAMDAVAELLTQTGITELPPG
jgi:hypothetical protein